MARVDADRNLLLGILAQQMDFVSRDALFEAMNAWIIRKETPLGALLVERGDLAKSRRDLLEALVDEHVKAHGGDPARSLQALSSVGPVAEDLQSLADSDLQASVAYLRKSVVLPPPLIDPDATRAPEAFGEPTSWNGRFRVVRPHSSGGLGVVSVALDDELDREVAFKEIKDKYADDGGRRARFVLEAEITGKLEHPGIIPIYGLGHDPMGRPFYAMRFIRGDSLADAINRYHDPEGPYLDPTKKSLQLRELLGRFLDVCDALAYAHSRGVLHRDLKPGNIMLGPFGETLVVDWGLALPLDRIPEGHDSTYVPVKATKTDSASLPREQGQVVGTPAYMPPEQAEGAIEKLGPRSDVYGLGSILYDLLTGKHPVEVTTQEETLQRVRNGEIKPPRQIRQDVPIALEAICLKALSLKPENRYPTPRALAADIKAWLADEPVSARKDPFAERARRWAKRNRTAVTGVAVALLVGLVGLGAVTAVQTKANADLKKANNALSIANANEKKANTDLKLANAALDEQRKRAESNQDQAIAAVKKFGDVIAGDEELKQNPKLQDLRKKLMNEPLAFFKALRERLQADHDTTPAALARLASASFDLGKLTAEIGDQRDALTAYREALLIRQKLADANPAVTQFQSNLATSHFSIGFLLSATGQPDAALKAYREALLILQKLADANPAVTQFQSDLAASHNNIGALLSDTGQPKAALKAYREAISIRQKLADANPAVTQFQSDLATSHNNIGNLLSATGQAEAALKAYREALSIRQKLADANPAVTQFQSNLAASHNNIGLLLSATGQVDAALKAYREALLIFQKLADANPAVTQFQSDLAGSQNNIGALLSATGQPDAALKAFREALLIQQKLADANPAVTQFQRILALSHYNIGLLLRATGQPDAALKAYREALLIRQKLAEANPAVTQFQSDLAASHNNIGALLSDTGQPDAALKAYREALLIRQKLAEAHPESSDFASDLGLTLHNLAVIGLNAKRFENARKLLREAVVWQRKALAFNPASPNYRRFLANHLTNLIMASRGLNDAPGVAEAERQLAELRESDPALIALDARLALILKGEQQPKNISEQLQLAQRAYDKGLHTSAAKLWGEAMDANPKVAESRNPQFRYNAACAAALAGCGQGKDDPAPDSATQARLREQARGWLVAELAVWAKLVDSSPAQTRAEIVKILQHWKEDADFSGVRDPKALEALPEPERKPWVDFWAELEALLARASK